ncbi:MAG TPA: hypothetical protein VKB41_01835 [Steroidobacteraceae bacterium]|nr:hypothetical protein [Steroidobacteraceae bacterium]
MERVTPDRENQCNNGRMRYVGIALGVLALYGAYDYLSSRPIAWRPGILVAADPKQTDLDDAQAIEHGSFKLIPRARFVAEARVLSSSRYRMGALAEVSPLDIAVGWGPMSDSAVLARLDISQGNRFYYWHYDDEPPIPREAIETHSANWHLVPQSSAVWNTLSSIRVGDVVKLEGELIDLERPDLGVIRTSLRRDDTGAGACEVILVQSVSFRYR